jgi:hypothetical protein
MNYVQAVAPSEQDHSAQRLREPQSWLRPSSALAAAPAGFPWRSVNWI